MTHTMVKGSNIPLETTAVRAVLHWNSAADGAPDIDALALLLGDDDRVDRDEDLVFYNQPHHPSGLVRRLPRGRDGAVLTDSVEARLDSLDEAVQRVLLVAAADGGGFSDVGGLYLTLHDASGEAVLASFDIEPETGSETVMLCGELYRRGDGWKFRALGQGYDTGLVGLATRFGVTVRDTDGEGATETARHSPPPGATVPQPPSEPDFPEPSPVPEPGPEPHPSPEPHPAPEPPGPVPPGPGPEPPGPEPVPGPEPSPGPGPRPSEPDSRSRPAGVGAFTAPDDQATRPGYGHPGPDSTTTHQPPPVPAGDLVDGATPPGAALLPPQGPQFLRLPG